MGKFNEYIPFLGDSRSHVKSRNFSASNPISPTCYHVSDPRVSDYYMQPPRLYESSSDSFRLAHLTQLHGNIIPAVLQYGYLYLDVIIDGKISHLPSWLIGKRCVIIATVHVIPPPVHNN
ncbi:hypothetical protein BASA50_002585 [Batrachochytrium salamandrivorans]|uniref:Uncharacterized protein n=1 Tax=Batrachochytrium salamandrivorans TaxID=1357716 RepID=A0ABQ8FKS2_9FUNG|nr:hypothetical protein BASA60_009269 [Batrachochytrium salamandrivorans]KAH6574801.1 hypothetical protein BASA62_002288 [Batrachochytrium salamandrivorans]KAH6579387.1 hypothetical protein BASA61_010270 [Batrachochytrium salamandrivorans]KAH6599996.1 hypothetical protein BASA50_002585 [Batrachochytrium salamandrivorans]KAH9271278.1 hypothetical protein BASA83_006601 [Batrachochytrium salamandrivorans]